MIDEDFSARTVLITNISEQLPKAVPASHHILKTSVNSNTGSRLMIIVSLAACCFASSDVPRQVFGYNAECDQATLYLSTCCASTSACHRNS